MEVDDIAEPNRLQNQIDFMIQNSIISIKVNKGMGI
jgi:hypothetical protein